MSFGPWIEYIRNAEKTSFISGRLRRIHYKMTDGAEMVEEYSMDTGILLKRAWKKRRDILCTSAPEDVNSANFNWDIELGERIQPLKNTEFLVKESSSEVKLNGGDRRTLALLWDLPSNFSVLFFCISKQPILTKRITRINIEWRIRNLPYPLDTYAITVDAAKKSIVIRTTNKKYFKDIPVPELVRCNITPEQDQLKITHQHNTLIITVNHIYVKNIQNINHYSMILQYKKPELVAQMERETLRILQDVETEADDDIDADLMKQLLVGAAGDAPNLWVPPPGLLMVQNRIRNRNQYEVWTE